jgi:hypothetical protein
MVREVEVQITAGMAENDRSEAATHRGREDGKRPSSHLSGVRALQARSLHKVRLLHAA